MTLVVGLTGGIGSGKTVASDHFATLGVPIIDTDVIARKVVEKGSSTLKQLAKEFGNTILESNGSLNRAALRNIAFSNNANKTLLDSITHPAIRQVAKQQIRLVTTPYCVVVVPLLMKADGSKSEFMKLMDKTTVVTAPIDIKIERIKRRSKLDEATIHRIMRSQADDQALIDIADYVLRNDKTIKFVHQQVEKLHLNLLTISNTNRPHT